MDSSTIQIALFVLAGCAAGAAAGWLIRGAIGQRRMRRRVDAIQDTLDGVTGQRDQFAARYAEMRKTAKSLQAAAVNARSELKQVRGKSRQLAENVLKLRTEREDTKIKVNTIQNALLSVKQQSVALQTEFGKARDFYKRELAKAFERRKQLEEELENARLEHESFTKLIESSISEHGSVDNLISDARLRFGQIDVLERNVKKLESENAKLNDDAIRMKRTHDELQRSLAEMEELRIHNQQLVRCVEALEDSRKQHETEAERYRNQAGESEQLSETLRLKLNDLEKNFADIERQQHQALEDARHASVIPIAGGRGRQSGN